MWLAYRDGQVIAVAGAEATYATGRQRREELRHAPSMRGRYRNFSHRCRCYPYTDTHGFTEQLFGLCHLLGYSFMPRLKDP